MITEEPYICNSCIYTDCKLILDIVELRFWKGIQKQWNGKQENQQIKPLFKKRKKRKIEMG